MSETICGHNRETLRWAIRTCGDDPNDVDFFACDDEQREALRVITDPANLGSVVVELLRLHDVGAKCHVAANGIILWEPRAVGGHGRLLAKQATHLTMMQARTLALRLLDAPNAQYTDIERMIEEVAHVVG